VAEVAEHTTEDDCLLTAFGKVYDVSEFMRVHPGGKTVMMPYKGADATDAFTAFHPKSAYDLLDTLQVGVLTDQAKATAFEKDVRALRGQMAKEGLFRSSKLYYAWKISEHLGLIIASVITLSYATTAAGEVHWPLTLAAGALLAAAWLQAGWLAHDLQHHQVVTDRRINHLLTMLCGSFTSGYAVMWWVAKHVRHHAVPNVEATMVRTVDAATGKETLQSLHDADGDIDTMPFLAWSKRMALTAPDSAWVRVQVWIYFPLLCIARLSWLQQSVAFAFSLQTGWVDGEGDANAMKYPTLQKAALLGHYAWLFGAMIAYATPAQALVFFFLAQCGCSLLLAIAFGVGHNGMATYTYENKPGWGELQCTTTRDVIDNPFVSWLMGGLQYQLEHHLFPMVPRHHLPRVKELIQPLCKKHGIRYHATGLVEGTVEVLSHLQHVSNELMDGPVS
jgi:fatty acid desaturase